MNKKIILTSFIALGFACPAMAESFPSDGSMLENKTYDGAATYDNTGVYEGNVTAQAYYDWDLLSPTAGQYLPQGATAVATCTTGSFCPGATDIHYDNTQDQGIESCPNGFDNSAAGATANTECYRTCDIANMGANGSIANIAHAATLTGNDYYGNGADTCEPATCVDGYHKYDPYGPTYEELITYIMNSEGEDEATTKSTYPTYAAAKQFLEDAESWENAFVEIVNPKKYGPSANENLKSKVSSADYAINGTGYAAIDNAGNQNHTGGGKKQSDYGLTENGTWGVSFSYGDIIGKSKCTATNGNRWATQGDPDATTSGEAKYCWCQGTGIKGTNGTLQSLASSWVFTGDYSSALGCANNCVDDCADRVQGNVEFRIPLFGSAGDSPAICEANTINITWEGATEAAVEANNAGSTVYEGDIRTPSEAIPVTGKSFKGWKFLKPSNNGNN